MTWYQTKHLPNPMVGKLIELMGAGRQYRGWFSLDKYKRKRFFSTSATGEAKRIPNKIAPHLWRPIDQFGTAHAQGLEPVVSIEAAIMRTSRTRPNVIVKFQTQEEQNPEPSNEDWTGEYSDPGMISREEAEHRLLRAVRFADEPILRAGLKVLWPVHEIRAEWTDYAEEHARAPERPTRRDISDWLTAMSWFTFLVGGAKDSVTGNIIYWRSLNPPFGWGSIGRKVSHDRAWVRRRYDSAIDTVWRRANAG